MKNTETITIIVEHDPTLWGQHAAGSALANELFDAWNMNVGYGGYHGDTNPNITITHYKQRAYTDLTRGLSRHQTEALKDWLTDNKQESAYVVSTLDGQTISGEVEAWPR